MDNQIPGYSAVYGCGCNMPSAAYGQPAFPQQMQQAQQVPSVQRTLPTLQNTMPGQTQQDQMTAPITDLTMPMPVTTESMQYMNGFLRTQLGKRVRVQFLIGTNSFLDKMGKLIGVGANYILLQEAMSDDVLVCDFFTIKFVTIYK